MNFSASKLLITSLVTSVSIALPIKSQAEDKIVVAYGVSNAEISKKAISQFEAVSGKKVEALREGGMGSDNILLAVDAGKAELGISGNSQESLVVLIKEKKMDVKNISKIQYKVLGQDSIHFMTYKGGPKELSKEQLKKIWSGEAKSWKDVGGEDVPVQLVIPNNTPATIKTISSAILDGADIYRTKIKIIDGGDETAKYVANTKGAISFGNPMTNFGEANRPKHLAISKPITAITLGAPTLNAAQIMAQVEKVLSGK